MQSVRTGGIILALMLLVGQGCLQSNTDYVAPDAIDDLDLMPEEEEITMEEEKPQYEFPGQLEAEMIEGKQVRITTAKGDIVFELFGDSAPLAVSNFVYLIGEGYYDGLTFHRREESFVIQGGDPNGNGSGGPGYKFEDELDDDYEYDRGIVAMANAGPDTNGSQFFIMLDDFTTDMLPKLYTVFGRVTEGMDVVDQIQVGDVMQKVTVQELGATADEPATDDASADESATESEAAAALDKEEL